MIKKYFIVILSSTLCSGCALLLPGHTNSNERVGEKVSLEMLKCSDLINDERKIFAKNYYKTFSADKSDNKDIEKKSDDFLKESCSNPSNKRFVKYEYEEECKVDTVEADALPVAAAASMAIGLATDFIKSKMEEEKTLYTAQYSARLLDDSFWVYKYEGPKSGQDKPKKCKTPDGKDGLQSIKKIHYFEANYIGFRFIRFINNKATTLSDHATIGYYGFKPSSDGNFFEIKPLYFHMNFAKAKILSNQAYTWLLPHTLLIKPFKISQNSVDVEIGVDMESYSLNKDLEFDGPKTIAAFKTNISGYNMTDRPELDANSLQSDPGWLLAPPTPTDEGEYSYGKGVGNFKLNIKVTERDTSEATKILEVSDDWVSKGGDKLKAIVEKKN